MPCLPHTLCAHTLCELWPLMPLPVSQLPLVACACYLFPLHTAWQTPEHTTYILVSQFYHHPSPTYLPSHAFPQAALLVYLLLGRGGRAPTPGEEPGKMAILLLPTPHYALYLLLTKHWAGPAPYYSSYSVPACAFPCCCLLFSGTFLLH